MARLDRMNEKERAFLLNIPCPTYDTEPWVDGPPLTERRVAIITTGGLHRRDDRPFTFDPGDIYRIIPKDTEAKEIVTTHPSTNFDHSGFQQDINVMFPIDRLKELEADGTIGSIADYHYSFMGAMDPSQLEGSARDLAVVLKKDNIDALLLLPV
jgi:D-proline reductase (dithiol) PrdB